MSKSTNSPKKESFERASRVMKERSRNLDEVCKEVLQQFAGCCPLHRVFVLSQRDVDFRAYVFFKNRQDVEESKRHGIHEKIIDCIYSELERMGRGRRNKINVAVEFDSDENVIANFEGSYNLRLR